jgi:hypothetical protein
MATYQLHPTVSRKGFIKVSKSAIFVVPDRVGKYVINFVYSPDPKKETDDPLVALSRHIFTNSKARSLAGQYIVQSRSDKTMSAGEMIAIGSWFAYGSAHQDLGQNVRQVRVYNPNGEKDEIAIKLYQAHADQSTKDENHLTPTCSKARRQIMTNFDSNGLHRISHSCMATAISLSINYVVEPHMDSGNPSLLEFIKMVNTNGELPNGHEWLFVVAGCILQLPLKIGDTVIVGLPAHGVYHGTLTTSSTENTYCHMGIGSALISKNAVMRSTLTGQTPTKYCASTMYGVDLNVSLLL